MRQSSRLGDSARTRDFHCFGSTVLGTLLFIGGLVAPALHAQAYLPELENALYYAYLGAASDEVEFDKNSDATGNLHSNEDVTLKQGVVVTGDVSAAGEVENSGTVTGAITEGASVLSLPLLPTEAAARALADRIFEGNVDFGQDEIIDDIVFVDGDARFHAALNGTGAVIAMGDIRLKKGSAGQLLAGTKMALVAHGDIRLDKNREFRGVLVAGEDVELKKESSLEGVALAGEELDVDKNSALNFLELDTQSPLIGSLQPADGEVVATTMPSASATWSDDMSGVDLATFSLLVDGVERAPEASASDTTFSWVSGVDMPGGPHTISVTISDKAGNEASATWSFTVDTEPVDSTPPVVGIVPFSDPHVVDDPVLTVSAVFADADSGIDQESVQAFIDGIDISTTCVVDQASASCVTPPLASGHHEVSVSVSDIAGNIASDSLDWSCPAFVDGLRCGSQAAA